MTGKHVPFGRRGLFGPTHLFPAAYLRRVTAREVDQEIRSGRAPFFPGMHERRHDG